MEISQASRKEISLAKSYMSSQRKRLIKIALKDGMSAPDLAFLLCVVRSYVYKIGRKK